MSTLHNVVYKVSTEGNTTGSFNKMNEAIDKLSATINNLNKSVVNVKVSDSATKGLDNLGKKANETEGIFKKLAVGIAGFFAFDAVKSGIEGVIKTGSDFEMMRLRLDNLTGSAEAGGEAFKSFQEDAERLPFALADIVKGNSGLMSMGLTAKESRKAMNDLANAVGFAGGNTEVYNRVAENMTQVKSKGFADQTDIKQFQSAGIQVGKALQASYGKTLEQLQKEGPITFEMIAKAMSDANKKGGIFEGGVDSLANSTSIKLSNLGDTVDKFAYNLFQDIQPMVNGTINLISEAFSKLQSAIDFMKSHKELMLGLAGAIGVVTGAIILYNVQQRMAGIYSALTNVALFAQMVATDGLAGAMYAAGLAGAGMWIAITGGIALAVAGIIYAYNKFDKFRFAIFGIWEAVKQVFTNIGNFFKATFKPIFDAIDNFKKGKYLEAGKNVLELSYNLSPVGLAKNAFDKIGEGVGMAFKKGYQNKASDEWQKKKDEETAKNKAKEEAKKAEAKKIKETIKTSMVSSAKGATSEVKNVSIQFEALQKIQHQHINDKKESRNILNDLNEGFTQILNNTNQVAK